MIILKKIFAPLLAVAMLLSVTACGNDGVSTPNADSTSGSDSSQQGGSRPETPSGELVIGSVTDLNADFLKGWNNGASNAGVRRLIHGYDTVAFTREGTHEIDKTVVKEFETADNEDGTKTYTITINGNLKYNDGTPITARDYVFSTLLYSSPEMQALQADAIDGIDYVGYDAFHDGETKTFSGVRLLDDYTFSLTVAADKFPFYYELTYASVAPYPMDVIAPGVELTDDGNGASLSDAFTVDLLRETIANSETGYRYLPKVTSGPYQMESFDAGSKQAVLTVNPEFLGTYDGVKPSIQKLVIKSVSSKTQMDELSSGSVGLIHGVSGGEEINAGLDLAEQGKAAYVSYDRSGYGKITFACDFGPTQFQAVRQAIAHLLDRDEFARQYSGGFAKVVDGYYGMAQWEYKDNRDALEAELNHYPYNPGKAKELLAADGWTLNQDGAPFTEGKDDIRYKQLEDGSLMPLIIEWANSPNNPVSDLISTMLPAEMAKVGMKLNATTLEFPVMLNNVYREGIDNPKYHMFNLATSFSTESSPWYYYSTDPSFFGLYNSNFIVDEELERLALDMKATAFEDKEGWSKKWLAFQKRWNEVLPDIPLYSDEYHDFFSPKLQNYHTGGLWDWSYEIVYAYV